MTPDNENLPVHQEAEETAGGTITYANEVIAIIAGIAANEVEGIAGMCTSGGFSDIIGKNRNVTRGVKVEVGTEEVSVDLYAIIEYGQPIQKVAGEVQENVRKSIEAMTSLKVVRVDVHVQGVSFEKEKREAQTNLEAVKWQNLPEGSKPKTREERRSEKKRDKAAQQEQEKAQDAAAEPAAEQPAQADEAPQPEPAAQEPAETPAPQPEQPEQPAEQAAPEQQPAQQAAPEQLESEAQPDATAGESAPAETPAAKKPARKPGRRAKKA